MRDEVTYFALTRNGQLTPIGTRDDLCDEIVAHTVERNGKWVAPVRTVPPEQMEDPSAPSFPAWMLAGFGICAFVGAWTLIQWLILAVGLII